MKTISKARIVIVLLSLLMLAGMADATETWSNNLAYGKTAFADGQFSGSYNVTYGVDGNYTTSWLGASGHSFPYNYTVDLGANYNIKEITLFPVHIVGYKLTNYTVFYSTDNTTYTQIEQNVSLLNSLQTGNTTYPNGTTMRYVRIQLNGLYSDLATGFSEIEIRETQNDNIALLQHGGTIVSSDAGSTWIPERLINNLTYLNSSGSWTSGAGDNTNFNVTFGFRGNETKSIYKVILKSYTTITADDINYFNVSVSTTDLADGSFSNVLTNQIFGSGGVTKNYTFTATNAKYVKLFIINNSGGDTYLRSPEFEIYENFSETPNTTPPSPSFISNTIGSNYINHSWQSGAGVVTDSYNVSHNGTWDNGTTNTSYNSTGLVEGDWSNITIWAWNNTGSGNLSSTSISNTSQIPISGPVGEWDDIPTCTNSSTAYYNDTSNPDYYNGIVINSSTNNTPCSITRDIHNSSIIGYNATRNEYILHTNIESRGMLSNLTIADTTFIVDGTLPINGSDTTDDYRIMIGGSVNFTNATINTTGRRFQIWGVAYGGHNTWTVDIIDTIIDGGWVDLDSARVVLDYPGSTFYGNTNEYPMRPIVITNLTIKNVNLLVNDTGIKKTQPGTTGTRNAGILRIVDNMGGDYTIDGLVLYNVYGGDINNTYTALLTISTMASNSTLTNIHVFNSTSADWGVIGWLGAMQNLTLENITIENIIGDGIGTKEGLYNVGKTHLYKNITFRNITSPDTQFGNIIHSYLNMYNSDYPSGMRFENLIIDGTNGKSNRLFAHSIEKTNDFWIFNASLYNSTYGFRVRNANYSLTNINISNMITDMYDDQWGLESGNVSWYELLDINVTDTLGNPISGAVITLTPNQTVTKNYSVDKWFNNTTSIITGADGHIPLPSNETGMVAVLRQVDNSIGTVKNYYNYTVTVTKSGYSENNTTVIIPLSSWYRSNPNSYQNSTTIILSGGTNPPNITSWSNNNSNNNNLSISVPLNTNVSFNITSNQTLTSCSWTGAILINCSADSFGYKVFDVAGTQNVGFSGSNANGTTLNTINWTVTVTPSFNASNNTISCPIGWCYLAMNRTNYTLSQLDALFTNDTVQGWFNATSQRYESHSSFTFNQYVNVTNKSGYYYYFKTATDVNVNITGNPSITLKSGWNLVGNMDTNRTLSDLGTSIGGTVVSTAHWNNTHQHIITGASETVLVGESFWVNVNADTAWSG